MELDKRKYNRDQVNAIIEAYKEKYENLVADLRSRISELGNENKSLLEQVEQYSNRERLIIKALESAEEKAEQIKEQAQLEYVLELQRLKEFIKKWDKYFVALKEKYPCDATKKALDIKKQVEEVAKEDDAKECIEKLDEMISEQNRAFNPKSKIKEYISATTSENGFNINEVLNPGKLELEDLCKELGLIEESE
ncbi:MAG: hypothetical protein E7372_00180 [Clostridiales bacterium]|nr:hypothetical protein [Clostridiales bacterium]